MIHNAKQTTIIRYEDKYETMGGRHHPTERSHGNARYDAPRNRDEWPYLYCKLYNNMLKNKKTNQLFVVPTVGGTKFKAVYVIEFNKIINEE